MLVVVVVVGAFVVGGIFLAVATGRLTDGLGVVGSANGLRPNIVCNKLAARAKNKINII